MEVGSRVFTPATFFDSKNDNFWSKSQFGDSWNTAMCFGVIKKIFKATNMALVEWELDGNKTKINCNSLRVSNKGK